MNNKSIGFKVGVALAAIHLCMVMLAYVAMMSSSSSTAGLVFIWFTFLDAPLKFIPHGVFNIFGMVAPLIQFGVLGAALWFLIPWVIDTAVLIIFPKCGRRLRMTIIVVSVVLILFVFFKLSFVAVEYSFKQERPAELKEILNSASSDFLTGKVILVGVRQEGVNSITRMNCRAGQSTEIILATPWSVVFFDSNYKEQHRFKFPVHYGFSSVEPFLMDGKKSCGFLTYRIFEKAYLFDVAGNELWKSDLPDKNGMKIDGVKHGDIDGDGIPEILLFHRFREGIDLLDSDGRKRWNHPVYSLGHVVITDINGDGKADITYSNSNNANNNTMFTSLYSDGNVADTLEVATQSSEFAVIKWPNKNAKPNFLLTENGKIRLIDQQGETVLQLDAPGCRTFGEVMAITVKFRSDEPEFLAVKKSLHPDISVLYVYDTNGKLLFQKNQVIEGTLKPTLATVPDIAAGTEKLLVGEYASMFKTQVVEYSLTR